MKKTYINPTTTIVLIEAPKLMAGSLGIGEEYQGGDVVLGREIDMEEELDELEDIEEEYDDYGDL